VKTVLRKLANGGTEIVRQSEDVHAMPANIESIEKRAGAVWSQCVDFVRKRDGVSESRAVDIALADPAFREAYTLQSDCYLQRMAKLGSGGWPGGTPHGSSSSDPEHPHTESEHHEGGDEALSRYRREHGNKQYRKFRDLVASLKASNPGWSNSKCEDEARRREPGMWMDSKQAHAPDVADAHVSTTLRKPFQPLAHDANAYRPPAGSVDAANWGLSHFAGPPYGRV